MTEFRFAFPIALSFLILPLLFYLRKWYGQPAYLRYPDIRLVADLRPTWRIYIRYLPDILRVVAWLLLSIVLARPQSGKSEEIIRGQGIDIVIALDISTSMAALDFEPENRLEAAKRVISDFIAGREFDRIGLVVFARNAFHQAPLTLDYEILIELLNRVQLVSELRLSNKNRLDGTAVGLGIASAANLLRSSTAPSKVIILLTDGANNAGIDPLQASLAAQALNIKVYTIGIGRPGLVDIPDLGGNIQTIESNLDEEALEDIATIAGGTYFRAEDAPGLQRIYDQIDTLERSDAERRIFVRWQDQIEVFLILTIFVMILERVLRHTIFQAVV